MNLCRVARAPLGTPRCRRRAICFAANVVSCRKRVDLPAGLLASLGQAFNKVVAVDIIPEDFLAWGTAA